MKNSKRYLAVLMTMSALLASGASQAQNPGNGGTTYSGLQATVRPEAFMEKFIDLNQAEATATATLATALGLAPAARPALALDALSADVAGAVAAAAAAQQQLAGAMAKPATLNDAAKANFAVGALALTQATNNYTEATKNLGAIKQNLALSGARAKVALYASRNTADLADKARAELKAVVAFAAANQIALAPEVTAAAAAM